MTALARLSFWVPAARLADFADLYDHHLVPILRQQGLAEAATRGRPTVAGVFSRLFEVEGPAAIIEKRKVLQEDPAWQEELRGLGTVFGTGAIPYHWGLYAAPAGPGKTVEAGTGFRQGLWQSFSVQDGFPAILVPTILRDRTGSLWFACMVTGTGDREGGGCRYDGAQFKIFTVQDGLVSNWVWSLLEDREGKIWFGTYEEGVYRYDGKEFVVFTMADGLASNNVRSMLEDQEGTLWFSTEEGVSRYDGKKFITFTTADGLVSNKVRCMLEDREGRFWFGTGDFFDQRGEDAGVSRYDGKTWTTFTVQDGLAGNQVWSLLQDREGELWFGTTGGVSRYDGKDFKTFTAQDGLTGNQVTAIFQDREGRLWFGDRLNGVSRYDGQGFKTFTIRDGLANNQVFSIGEDREGHLWFGTYGGGVSRYDGQQFKILGVEEGLVNNGVMSLLEDREGHLWFGTWGGVSRYDGVQFTTIAELAESLVFSIVEDREGHLWFGTQGGGVSRLDGQGFKTFTTQDGLASNGVLSILEDRQGQLWFGTLGGGVSRFDGTRFTTFTPEDGLAHNVVWPILEDRRGNLWFGTWGGGVSRFDGEHFTNLSVDDGLAHNTVFSIAEDREGQLWFGTRGGVSRFDGEHFTTFTVAEGLAHNQAMSIIQAQDGHLWFGTWGGGVSRYDGQVFQRLSKRDGLVHDVVQKILQDRHGDIWITTEGGITRYRPHPTHLSIQLIEVIADYRYGPVEELQLPVSQRFIRFEFQGQSFTTRPEGMAYVYRLVGYEDQWQTTYARRVEYQGLPLGEYTFQVKAVDRDLNYSEPIAVQVSVVPDPHLTALTQALNGSGEEFVGESAALAQVQVQLEQVAHTGLTTLILGEAGTGKGLAARIVHRLSPGAAGPFVQVNCGALPEGLVESELFGHERGAFTGAVSRKIGKVELAEGGTLFLDEIGDLSPTAQAKLLQVLEERTFERVGGTETLCAEVRVIAATNRDLRQMVAQGTFREDLYFRLQGFPLTLPPLRRRQGDIPMLASYFAARMAAHLHKRITHFTKEALAALSAYAWPGNVRELEHVVKRAVVVCPTEVIGVPDLFLGRGEGPRDVEPLLTLEEAERRHILQVLEQTNGVIKGPTGAAALLGVPASTLYGRMKKLGIQRT